MANVWFLASLWVGLALIATLLAIWLKVSTALSEIVVGTVAQLIVGVAVGRGSLGGSSEWMTFLAGTGAILLTFLAGAELDPRVFRRKWRAATVIGLVGFFGPFIGATLVARFLLGWDPRASWLAGVALSTTSVAVVYAVMLELGFNRTEFGKAILAACFINDLGTVVALGLIFSPFTLKTLTFVVVSIVVFAVLPYATPRFFARYGGTGLRARGQVHPVHAVHHGRTRGEGRTGWYYTLMMSTGLTFGTISALFGLNHGIISQAQYSYLVATVIGSAVVPTVIANAFFMPSHLLSETPLSEVTGAVADGAP
jgi:Kef-type K+ transport system membrane component KefB